MNLLIKLCLLFFLFFSMQISPEEESLEILLSSNNSIYLSTLQSIQSTSKRKLNLNFTNSMNESELKDFFSSLEKKKAPLLITLGQQASLTAKENLANVSILYSLMNAPRALGFNYKSNTCGIHIDVPIQEIFRALKDIKPEAKNIAAFYSNNAGELLVNEADYTDSLHGIIFHKIKIESKSDFTEKLFELKNKIDAFYIVPDAIYTEDNFEILSKFAKENKIVLMTQIPFIVNVGTTFSITPYYARVGTFIGELANEVLAGKVDCKYGYANSVKEFSLSLNKSFAEESGIALPANILKRAENSRLLIEGIHFYERGNLDVSNLVMEKILKEDPTNFTAFYYKNFINQRINGDKIAEFFRQAKDFRTAKNYKKEREKYNLILSLQSDNQNAKLGFQESLVLESESEREEGERLESGNQFFAAIQKYLNSVKILDTNTKSKANLTRIRQKEIRNVPAYIQKGKESYENRKYGESEEMFQNILLVEPENKNAKEYLRLSKEKKMAMLKYENCIREADKKCYLLWEK